MQPPYVLGFHEVDRTRLALVGGKGSNLGELSRVPGIRVPEGFCVTTAAFEAVLAAAPAIVQRVDRLSRLAADDREAIRAVSAEVGGAFEDTPVPDDVAAAISGALGPLGDLTACAVRSSATAEDLPGASFAGQHDSYLNVVGAAAILRHVQRCWGSLFTERAVTYRLRHGIDHRTVSMAVVVQKMVSPRAAGVLFTADPVTSNRKVASVEAVAGLGESLVSGLVNPDVFQVRDGQVAARPQRPDQPVLADAQVARLVDLGRRIEAHFGCPQDIEWCLDGDDDDFWFVQSRPITTLFPVPARSDRENHVYVSVGHQQMMTDAMRPLGLSFFLLITPAPMFEAGGRLFVDVTPHLASPARRAGLLQLSKSDPLIRDALQTIVDRGFVPSLPDDPPAAPAAATPPPPLDADPGLVTELIARTQASIAALKRDIQGKSGPALLDFILTDLQELKRILFDRHSHRVFMTAIDASGWLNDHLLEWLGEKNAADVLTQSVPHNVTSEMGLALMDVADAIRPHPEAVAFLQGARDDGVLDELPRVAGGREARDAILGWLDRYGMRGVGEIDITRPRWRERPATLLPLLLGNIKNFQPGAGARRFEQGRQEAERAEQALLQRLRALPDGEQKAAETKRMIDRVRAFIGYREYPKYAMVSRTFVYKQALLEEAGRLVADGVLRDSQDIFYLTLPELQEVVRARRVDAQLLDRRKEAFRWHQTLRPPRVLTSDGEAVAGAYRRDDLPAGALVGLPVSAGTVEGRARVILDLAQADLEPGDILVTAYTDPSWTPLFVAIAGLVTEVGGLMTHGAVIAREYGLPAVVGVENATRLIRDGQRIRVHGTDGHVELLS
ncbi:MAG TPA: rifamycin-inactivating phosphotransferase [Polyangia bacterium]|nr:rifamycin-inactivating phosphotransferase [Polyangia bacterium]